MSKSSLKNKVDSIRRTLKSQGHEVASPTVESKILELYPDFEDEWSSDARAEVIRALVKDLQPQGIKNAEITAQLTQSPKESAYTEAMGQLTLSVEDKQVLITSQSEALNISLSEEDTAVIADSIDDVFADYSSFVLSVNTAIKGYIAHKFDEIECSLETNTTDIRDYLLNRTNRLNEKLSNYANSVKGIKSDTQTIRQGLKRGKENILSRFRT